MKSITFLMISFLLTYVIIGCKTPDKTTKDGDDDDVVIGDNTADAFFINGSATGTINYYFDEFTDSEMPFKFFPRGTTDSYSFAATFTVAEGFNNYYLEMEDLEASPIKFVIPGGHEHFDYVSGNSLPLSAAFELEQVEASTLSESKVNIYGVWISSFDNMGDPIFDDKVKLATLTLKLHDQQDVNLTVLNSRTFNGSIMTSDFPPKYNESDFREFAENPYFKRVGVTFDNYMEMDRDLDIDTDNSGGLTTDAILPFASAEFLSVINAARIPDRTVLVNMKDIHTSFTLNANVSEGDNTMILNQQAGSPGSNVTVQVINSANPSENEEVIVLGKVINTGSTYAIEGQGPNNGFQFAHSTTGTVILSTDPTLGIASSDFRVAIVQEIDAEIPEENVKPVHYNVAAHEILHSNGFELNHVPNNDDGTSTDPENIMTISFTGGTDLREGQWTTIHNNLIKF